MFKIKKQKGITLIALIITIVVLLILAAVAINAINDYSIIDNANAATEAYSNEVSKEGTTLDGYESIINQYLNGETTIEMTQTVAKLKNKVLSETENTEVYDKYGNKIIVPPGFKILVDSTTNNAETVTAGIVIEDCTETSTKGSQFVWIPVGKIYTDVARKEVNAKTITLGRYIFNSNGTINTSLSKTNPTDQVKTSASSTYIFTEGLKNASTINTHAKDIEAFITSSNTRGGYYLGRYEAGDSLHTSVDSRTGSNISGELVCKANQVPYNWITQLEAANKCRNMYGDGYQNGTFSSDIVNSYAWDTAILFIQTFGTKSNSSKYSATIGKSSIDTSKPQLTGTNKLSEISGNPVDEQLNIYDLAGNCSEWSSETCYTTGERGTYRGGGYYYIDRNPKLRGAASATYSYTDLAFRPVLYVGL